MIDASANGASVFSAHGGGKLQFKAASTFKTNMTTTNRWGVTGKTSVGVMSSTSGGGGMNFVNGSLRTSGDLKTSSATLSVPDYVFEPDYALMPLAD